MAGWLLASPVAAQHHGGGGGGGGSSHGGGGGSHGGGGGSHGGGGGAVSRGGSSGGGFVSSGNSSSSGTQSGGGSVARQPMGSTASGSTGSSGGAAVPRGSSGATGADPGSTTGSAPPYSRPRGNTPPVGTAEPRNGPPPQRGGTVVTAGYPWFVPWGFGGIGYYGLYGGGYCDPMWDPDCGDYGPGYGGGPDVSEYHGEGNIRLKVTPVEAQVFVDGGYVGVVDDFNGVFQRLHVEAGPHHVEIREDGYEPLTFDANVERGRTLTYRGELKKIE